MKKLLLALCLWVPSTSLLALPIGNPWEASLQRNGILWDRECCNYEDYCPSWWDAFSFRLGYYGDFVFDRHLQVDRKNNHSTIHKTKINTNAAYFAFNMCNRIDLFGTLGATQINFSAPYSAFGGGTVDLETNLYSYLDTETTFSWSLGLRGTLFECGCFGVGAEAQYFRTRPHLNSVSISDLDTFYFVNEERPRYHEWQVGLGAAYRIYIAACSTALVPYVGVKWSNCKFTTQDAGAPIAPNFTVFDLKNNRNWGYAIGMTLLGCSKSSVTVEGRFADEKAVYVNGQFRF